MKVKIKCFLHDYNWRPIAISFSSYSEFSRKSQLLVSQCLSRCCSWQGVAIGNIVNKTPHAWLNLLNQGWQTAALLYFLLVISSIACFPCWYSIISQMSFAVFSLLIESSRLLHEYQLHNDMKKSAPPNIPVWNVYKHNLKRIFRSISTHGPVVRSQVCCWQEKECENLSHQTPNNEPAANHISAQSFICPRPSHLAYY